jgi:hypothetical protein
MLPFHHRLYFIKPRAILEEQEPRRWLGAIAKNSVWSILAPSGAISRAMAATFAMIEPDNDFFWLLKFIAPETTIISIT